MRVSIPLMRAIAPPLRLLWIIAALLLALVTLGVGYVWGRNANPDFQEYTRIVRVLEDAEAREQADLQWSFVQDALTRWAIRKKASKGEILAQFSPQVMAAQERACVQFVQRSPGTGGAPAVYCYPLDQAGRLSTKPIWKYDELGE